MGAFFGAIISWLLSRIFKQAPPPSRVEVLSREAGSVETKLADVAQASKAQTAIAQAVTDAPKDVAGVEAELRKGTF